MAAASSLLLTALLAPAAEAGFGFTSPVLLNTNGDTDTFSDYSPSVATDTGGNWVAVWHSSQNLGGVVGTDTDIFFSTSSDNGNTWSAPAPLNTNATTDSGSDSFPRVATDENGKWIVVWTSREPSIGASGTDRDIVFSSSVTNGAVWTAPALLNTNGGADSGEDTYAQIDDDAHGNWVAVWSSTENLLDPWTGAGAGTDADIAVATSTDNGVSWTSPAVLNSGGFYDSGFDHFPQIRSDRMETWVAVWASNDSTSGAGLDVDVFVATSMDVGGHWSSADLLNTNGNGDSGTDSYPQIATQGNGSWVAVWNSTEDLNGSSGTDYDILVSRSTSGEDWTFPALLNSSGSSDTDVDSNPRLSTDGQGAWLATWYRQGGTTGTDGDIFGALSGDDGQSWSVPGLLNDTGSSDTGSDKSPSIRSDGAGQWIAAWESTEDLNGNAGTDADIFFATSDDIDGDGLSDYTEATMGTDPLNPDSDADGLLDGVETGTGSYVSPTDTGTDPLEPDTDSDGYGDGDEVAAGTDPNDGSSPGPVEQNLAIYPSPGDDGLPGDSIEVRGTALVPVYFNNGLSGGGLANQCTAFGGNEVCEWVIQLETTGDLWISGIDWGGSVVSGTGSPMTFTSVPDSGGWVGATRIATIAVTGTLGELRLTPMAFYDRFGNPLSFPNPGGVLLAQASPMPWTALSVVNGRGCGVLGDGSLRCWGSGSGQGLFGIPPSSGAYREVMTGATPSECALDLDGNAQCWGVGAFPPTGKYLDLVAGDAHRCGLFVDGEVACWDAATGVLDALGGSPSGPFRMLTRGANHVCGLRTDGNAVCWGNDSYGQATPPTGSFEALAGGSMHTCGIRPGTGSVECWGDPSDGKTAAQAGPFVALSAGDDHTCGIGDDGLVTCWGATALGQLAAPPDAFVAISASSSFTCGISEKAEILCWGEVPAGFLSAIPAVAYARLAAGAEHVCEVPDDGTVACYPLDSAPSGPVEGPYRAIASGRDFGVLIDTTGTVEAFGTNDSGQTNGLTPAAFALQIAAGEAHACQLLADNRVDCWGDDSWGQATQPFAGDVPQTFLQISAGDRHSCGIVFDGNIQCWGDMGLGASDAPLVGSSGSGERFVQVSSGAHHNCARRANGTVACWGENDYGQATPPAGAFVHVTAGATHSCGLRPDSRVECWGDDGSGAATPDAEFYDLSAGGDYPRGESFTCGIRAGGARHCWGSVPAGLQQPPDDGDFDWVSDIADNCPSVSNPLQVDSDSDGVGDACDVCPVIPDPAQLDRDRDTHGDVCDACPDNDSLFEEGDICRTTVRVQGSPGRSSFARSRIATANTFQLNLVCPATDIGRLEMGLVMPAGVVPATDVIFGGGCEGPISAGCTTATLLGSTVDPEKSFVIKPTASYMTGYPSFAGDLDTLYFVLVGNENGSSEPILCTGDVVTLATFTLPTSTPPALVDAKIGDVGTWCSATGPCDSKFFFESSTVDPKPVSDSDGKALSSTEYAKAVGDGSAAVEVRLRPRTDDPDGRMWDVELLSSKRVSSLTLGFIVPGEENAEDESMSLVGCDLNIGTSFTLPLIDCAGNVDTPDLQASVYQEESWVLAYPTGAELVGEVRTDTLYARFTGAHWITSPESGWILNPNSLDPVSPSFTRIGTLRINEGEKEEESRYDGDPPVVTLQGVSDLVLSPSLPVETLDPPAISVDDFLLTGTGATGEDYDGDANPNDSDNCRYAYNPDQMDRGGVMIEGGDGRGDVCECGDGNGDGLVGVNVVGDPQPTDVESLQKILSGQTSEDSGEQTARCSTYGDTACDILDIVILAGAAQPSPAGPGIAEVCLRSVSSEVPNDP